MANENYTLKLTLDQANLVKLSLSVYQQELEREYKTIFTDDARKKDIHLAIGKVQDLRNRL